MYANWVVCETDRVEQNNQRRCVVVGQTEQSRAQVNCILLQELARMAATSCSSNIIGEITMTRFVLFLVRFSK